MLSNGVRGLFLYSSSLDSNSLSADEVGTENRPRTAEEVAECVVKLQLNIGIRKPQYIA